MREAPGCVFHEKITKTLKPQTENRYNNVKRSSKVLLSGFVTGSVTGSFKGSFKGSRGDFADQELQWTVEWSGEKRPSPATCELLWERAGKP